MKLTLILTSLLALAGNSFAGPRVPFGNGELPEAMKAYDVDGDGALNAEERQAFRQAMHDKRKAELLAKFDTDGDGVLSTAELAAAREAARKKIEDRRVTRFTELDKDGDGKLSATEFVPPGNLPSDLVARLFDFLNGDDEFISQAEFLAGCRRPGEGIRPPSTGGGTTTPPPPPPGEPLPTRG